MERSGGKLITIVTTTYNSEEYIETQLREVSKIKTGDVEWIVIDAESSDKTQAILSKYRHSFDKYIVERDGGIYEALNKASKMSSGVYIIVAHSDDILIAEGFAELKKQCEKLKYDAIVGAILNDGIVKYPSKLKLIHNMTLNHTAMAIRTSVLRDFNYNEDYKIASDYDLALQLLKAGKKIKLIKAIVAYMRVGGKSSQKYKTQTEVKIIQQKHFGKKIQNLVEKMATLARKLIK